ncbi:MAG TPA: NUDIX hydrolase, partial [Candidatus Dormibacteraeota bacterium]|nr:NUDIX hydrolase [Candidatus Dormibacteraeota bacterium]
MVPPSAINEGPPVTPRPSATVLLVRGEEPWELLMVQRPGGADFAPGAWVFPGGTVIEDDRSFEDELRAAAVREVFEEVGILLASDAGDAECMWVGRELRRGISFSGSMHKAGLAPDFGALVIFARWVTP